MKPIEGEPAFPLTMTPEIVEFYRGLSERRYYIGQALMGFNANPNFSHAQADDIALLVLHQADHIMKALYPQTEKETN